MCHCSELVLMACKVASKKLGLDRVVLGKAQQQQDEFGEGKEIEKALEKEEIERLLKHGAYDLFRSDSTFKEEDFDFDKILETASTVTYGAKGTDSLAR